MDFPSEFPKLGISLLLGLLVGLQREKANSKIGGLRTFPLVTLLGSACALLAKSFGGTLIVGGLVGIMTVILIGNFAGSREKDIDVGITTEIAMLMMFVLGALVMSGSVLESITIGGIVAVLLQFKPQLHGFAAKLGDTDLKGIMRFVILAFIILPILPNEVYGPFEVLNPREIWLMVVVIVGLNFSGYILYKIVDDKTGTFTLGALGGLISSTATTISFAKLSRDNESYVPRAATILIIASTIVYVRVIGEMAAVSHTLFKASLVPIGLVFFCSTMFCVVSYYSSGLSPLKPPKPEKPGDVRSALYFGLTYAIVVFTIAAWKKYFGEESLFWVAAISGLTDVDAITLSTARLVASNQLEPVHGQNMVLIAVLSNLTFKCGIVLFTGNRLLFKKVGLYFAISLLTGIAALFIW